MNSKRAIAEPEWLRGAIAVAAMVGAGIALFVERDEIVPPLGPAQGLTVSVGLAVFLLGMWLIVVSRRRTSAKLLMALVAPAMCWFVIVGRSSASPMALILMVTWITFTGAPRDGIVAVVVALISVVAPLPIAAGDPVDWVGWIIGILFAWAMSRSVRSQRELVEQLRVAQEALAERAALEERQRVARELHDVIAHTLAITLLHLTGARHILTRDPAVAADALARAEHLGRQSLADLRRTVGLLGGDTAPQTEKAPLPSANDISHLVEEYISAGLPLSVSIAADLTAIPPSLGLDLYRITQEALANVVKHAHGAATRVHFEPDGDRVRLTISNQLASRGVIVYPVEAATETSVSGRGLAGIRERVARHHGSCEAGQIGSEWVVACTLPIRPSGPSSAVGKEQSS